MLEQDEVNQLLEYMKSFQKNVMKDELEELAQKIIERRKEIGLSQRKLAQKIDMYPAYIICLEQGSKNPTVKTLARIADGLDCDLVIDLKPRNSE